MVGALEFARRRGWGIARRGGTRQRHDIKRAASRIRDARMAPWQAISEVRAGRSAWPDRQPALPFHLPRWPQHGAPLREPHFDLHLDDRHLHAERNLDLARSRQWTAGP